MWGLPFWMRVALMPVSALRALFLLVAPWRVLLALLSGLLLALAFPPADWGWLAWLALIPLLVAVRDLRPSGGFVAGLTAGTLFFALLLVYIRQFGLLPWLALAVFQGLFVALFGYLAALMWRCPCPWIRVAALGAAWTTTELLRGHLGALQFTFGDLGYSQHQFLPALQVASLFGHYGLGSVIALFAAAVIEGVPRVSRNARLAAGGPLVVLGCLLLIGAIWGAVRARSLRGARVGPGIDVVAVQGDITGLRTSGSVVDDSEEIYIGTSLSAGLGADLIVWPETALPVRLNEDPELYARVRSVPERLGCTLLAGAAEGGPAGQTYNTLWAFDREGRLLDRYRKRQLVVFGEYLPWREHLRFLMNAYPLRPFDFSPGSRDVLVPVDHALCSPMICFESIFPDVSRRLVRRGAQVLVVSTSDTWVGRSPAELAQHAQCSVLRAVETGRWLVRAGGTGVTCIIDPSGRVVASTPPFEPGTVRADVWPETRWTPYELIGDLPLALIAGLLLLAGLTDLVAASREEEGTS